MTAAYRLKGLGWFASCTAIVLGFYLVSLQVASERNKLDALNGRIRTAERDIRALETEFDTRANLQQLERWNGDILALSAPVAGQFVRSEAQLASVNFDGVVPLGGAEMKTAALVVPSMPALAPVEAPVVVASIGPAVQRTPSTPATARRNDGAPAEAPVAIRANLAASAAPSAKLQRVAMLDDGFLADLGAAARAEAGRR
jgi:hypothetical protein